MTTQSSQDRADVERVFHAYVQSITAADVMLASQVWLQSPDVLVVTPFGRYQGWDSVQNDIYPWTKKELPNRNLQANNVSIVVAGDAAWVVYDFVFPRRERMDSRSHPRAGRAMGICEPRTAGASPICTIQCRRRTQEGDVA